MQREARRRAVGWWRAAILAVSLGLASGAVAQTSQPAAPQQAPPPSERVPEIPPGVDLYQQDDPIVGEDPLAPEVEVPFLTGPVGWGWSIAGIVAAAILAYLSRLAARSLRRRRVA